MAEISVLTTFRDPSPAWLEECLSSVETQDADFEVLMWDDGSRDGSRSVAADRANGDPRFRLCGHGRVGRLRALGLVLAAAKAPLAWVLDADDVVLPGGLAMLCALMEDGATVGVAGYEEIVDGAMLPGRNMRFAPHPRSMAMGRGFWMFHPVMRRAAVLEAGGIGECDGAEDYDLALRLEETPGFRAAATRRIAWRHRIHPGQFSLRSAGQQRDAAMAAARAARVRRGWVHADL